ncbi:hypothetical protein E2C01_040771 [Portunus trituberculatus]|uniref:Uncharacterized protein n=1 Tax=Portunus trituberculatus TaxID=210409 RepID=A0A5B7FNV5_PORTR|nr:hypothetical protein [Portunus trituberculatus]
MTIKRYCAVLVVMAVVGMAAGARPRQLIVSEVSEREIASESLDVWNPENGKSRPENREETQGAASSLPILSFLEPWTSAITQCRGASPELRRIFGGDRPGGGGDLEYGHQGRRGCRGKPSGKTRSQ